MGTAMTFGKMVKKYREDLGWSQIRLAAECGMDRKRILDIEKDRANPCLRTVNKLARVLEFYTEWDTEEK